LTSLLTFHFAFASFQIIGLAIWLYKLDERKVTTVQTDDIIAKAKADLQRAERNVSHYRVQMENAAADALEITAFLKRFEFYAVRGGAASAVVTRSDGGERLPAREGSKSRRLVDECIKIIEAAGAKVDINDLLNGVLAAGLEIGGRDEKSNLAGYLSRDARVTYTRGEGWALVNEGATETLAGQQAAPSSAIGGTDDGPTLTVPGSTSRLATLLS
jgi:hypothetical protein